jgi:hypothetical protein
MIMKGKKLANRKEANPVIMKEESIIKEIKGKGYNIPVAYQSSLTWSEKCLYFLSTGESMSMGDIFKKISDLEPNMSYAKMLRVKRCISRSLIRFIENKVVKEVEARKFGFGDTDGRKVVINGLHVKK